MKIIDVISEDRLGQQSRFHPDIPERVVHEIAAIDPTPQKFYLRWLMWLYVKGRLDVRRAEDIRQALFTFHRAKLKKLLVQPDILKYPSVEALERLVTKPATKHLNKRRADIQWTYQMSVEKNRNYWYFAVHCDSNVDENVTIRIDIRGCWLGWRPIDSYDAIQRLQKNYGGTGLMKSVTQAIHEAVGMYLEGVKPECITIQGSDPMRERLYQSWINWSFPGVQDRTSRPGYRIRPRRRRNAATLPPLTVGSSVILSL